MKRIFIDNFEDILRWESTEANATAIMEISDVKSFRGGGCLHVKNIDAAPTDHGTIIVATKAMLTEDRTYKISGEMKFGTKTNIDELVVILRITIEGYQFAAGIKYSQTLNKFYYMGTDGTWKLVFDSELTILSGTWFTFSINVDFANTKMRMISVAGKDQEIDARLYGAVDGTPDRIIEIQVQGQQNGTTAGFEFWVDNIRLEGE